MGAELFIGLVGAVGTNLSAVTEHLSSEFRRVGYTAYPIRLSAEITKFKSFTNIDSIKQHDIRVGQLMTAGDQLREVGQRGDAVGLLGVSRVREKRGDEGGSEDKPLRNTVYIFHSLKRREEVKIFRDTYGSNFLLISVFEPLSQRRRALCDRISESHGSYNPDDFGSQADDLIKRDRKESEKPLGQDVEATFPEADLFLDASDLTKLGKQISTLCPTALWPSVRNSN